MFNYTYLVDYNIANFKKVKVKQFTKRSKKGRLIYVKSYNRNLTKLKKLNTPKNQKRAGIGAGIITGVGIAATLGLSTGSYKFLVTRYRSNFKTSALWVKQQLLKNPNLPVAIDPAKKRIHFAVTGLENAIDKDLVESKHFAKLVATNIDIADGQVIPINTTIGNVKQLGREYNDFIEQAYHGLTTMAGDKLKKGYNPISRNIALQVSQTLKEHPNKDIVLHGFSYGGMANNEAIQILKHLDIDTTKIKVINYGSPYFNLVPIKDNNYLSFVSHKDIYAKPFLYPNTNWTKEPHKHNITDYFTDTDMLDKVNKFVTS